MCRIFYNPNQSMSFVQDDLCGFFETLEKRAGGDGNGVYMMGLDESVKTMNHPHLLWHERERIGGKFIFHTRMATHGKKKTYNVQPLVNCRYVIAHNGIFSQWKQVGVYLGLTSRHSDSHSILNLISRAGILSFYRGFIDKYYGVVLVYDKEEDKTYLCKSSGTFEAGQFPEGEWIYGSSNLKYWKLEKTEDLDNGLYLLKSDGYVQIHKPIVKTYNRTTYTSYYGDDWEQVNGVWRRKKIDSVDQIQPDYTLEGKDIYSWMGTKLNWMKLDKLNPKEEWEKAIDYYAEENLDRTAKTVKEKLGRILTPDLISKIKSTFWLDICPKCLDDDTCGSCSLWQDYLQEDGKRAEKRAECKVRGVDCYLEECENCFEKDGEPYRDGCYINAINCQIESCDGCNYKMKTDEEIVKEKAQQVLDEQLERISYRDNHRRKSRKDREVEWTLNMMPCGYAKECDNRCDGCNLMDTWQEEEIRREEENEEPWWKCYEHRGRNWD